MRVPLGLCSKFQARSHRCAAPSQRRPCPTLGHHQPAQGRNKSAAFRGIFFISKHIISVLWQNNPPSAFQQLLLFIRLKPRWKREETGDHLPGRTGEISAAEVLWGQIEGPLSAPTAGGKGWASKDGSRKRRKDQDVPEPTGDDQLRQGCSLLLQH